MGLDAKIARCGAWKARGTRLYAAGRLRRAEVTAVAACVSPPGVGSPPSEPLSGAELQRSRPSRARPAAAARRGGVRHTRHAPGEGGYARWLVGCVGGGGSVHAPDPCAPRAAVHRQVGRRYTPSRKKRELSERRGGQAVQLRALIVQYNTLHCVTLHCVTLHYVTLQQIRRGGQAVQLRAAHR